MVYVFRLKFDVKRHFCCTDIDRTTTTKSSDGNICIWSTFSDLFTCLFQGSLSVMQNSYFPSAKQSCIGAFYSAFFPFSTAYRILQCDHKTRLIDIPEDEQVALTCNDVSPLNNVTWRKQNSSSAWKTLGTCNLETCKLENNDYFISRPYATTSQLLFVKNRRENGQGEIQCYLERSPLFDWCYVRSVCEWILSLSEKKKLLPNEGLLAWGWGGGGGGWSVLADSSF